MVKVHKSVLGEDWFQSFSVFRLNPEAFLDKRKLTRDAFCLDVLKDLYLDSIENQSKIHLLLLLQEHSTLLINDPKLLEQVVESLSNLCLVLGSKPDKRILKSQILVTIVTILLSQNLEEDVSRFVLQTKALLLDLMYNTPDDSIVSATACNCLSELEQFYSGVLETQVALISIMCEKEISPIFQNYVLLLSVCVKHMVTKLNNRGSISASEVPNDKIEISPLVSHLLESLPLMTHTASYRVLKDLISIVKQTPELSPMTFKLYLQSLMRTSDVLLFHLAFDLLDEFGSQLVSSQDQSFLFKQLINLSTHPCLSSSHRLLFLDWLKSCIRNSAYFTSVSHTTDLSILLPSPFDGPLTQEKKANILALCVAPETKEDLTGEFLNELVSGLVKCSLLSGGTKAAPSLFRTLLIFLLLHKSEIMQNSLYRLLTGIVKTSLHLTPYALNFLQAVKSECGETLFHEKVLGHLVEHILSIPMKKFYNNLDNYLTILESAAQECASICRPRAVLRLLQKLLSDPTIKLQNLWSTGNDILAVCRLFLKYHDVQIFYYDLAEVLNLIILNTDDTDVKDRAKIYYSMLTSLSTTKIQNIFSLQSSERDARNALNSFVTGGDAFQFAPSIQKLTKPILQLERISPNSEIDISEIDASGQVFPDILEIYQQHLINHEPVLTIPFALKHINSEDSTFSNLYSLIINTQSDPASKKISVIEIPVLKDLKKPNSKETVANLILIPREPYPITLHFKAEFTCDNRYSYTCNLPSVVLDFEDLFMPLPVPELIQHADYSWRQQLFVILWDRFKEELQFRGTKSRYCQSSFCLQMKKEEFPLILEHKLKHFIVARYENFAYNIAVFLPPKNHILMKFCVINDKPFVNIIVDNSATLPCVTQFLQNLSKIC